MAQNGTKWQYLTFNIVASTNVSNSDKNNKGENYIEIVG